MVKRTISVHQDLLAFAVYAFQLRHKLIEVGGWQGE
jgi:hypothetical protein